MSLTVVGHGSLLRGRWFRRGGEQRGVHAASRAVSIPGDALADVMPPSTSRCVPVTKRCILARQIQRGRGNVFGLSGAADRLHLSRLHRSACRSSGRRRRASSPTETPKIGVTITPGQIALTRILCTASWAAASLLRWMHASFGDAIGKAPAGFESGNRRGVDDRSAAARNHQRRGVLHAEHRPAQQQVKVRVPVGGRHVERSSRGVPPVPALLNRISSPPNAACRSCIAAAMSASDVTSQR